jgi:hypothetical protein
MLGLEGPKLVNDYASSMAWGFLHQTTKHQHNFATSNELSNLNLLKMH